MIFSSSGKARQAKRIVKENADIARKFSIFLTPQLEAYNQLRTASMLSSNTRMTNTYAGSTGTSNLRRHIRTLHRNLWEENTEQNGWKDLDELSTNSSEQHRPREEFNVDRFHDQLVRFIVADDQVSPWCTPNDVSTSHCFISLGD